jgi:hypothetical protein
VRVRVEGAAVAKVIVERCDVVGDPAHGKGPFEHGRSTDAGVALVTYGDAGPAKYVIDAMTSMGSVGTHPLCRSVRRDDFAPIGFDGGREQRFCVRKYTLAVGIGVVIDDTGRWMNELIVRTEMEVEGFPKGGKSESEGV